MFRTLGFGVAVFVMVEVGRHYLGPLPGGVRWALIAGSGFVGAAFGALLDLAGRRP